MIDYDGKEAALQQPLRSRKDYGEEQEAAMLKAVPPLPEDTQMVVEDYDKPPVLKLRQQRGPGGGCPPPEGKGKMPCPQCMRKMLFKLAALESQQHIICPYCDVKVATKHIHEKDSSYYPHDEDHPSVSLDTAKRVVAGWVDKQKAIDNVSKAMSLLGWQGGTVHQVAHETGLTVEQIHEADDIEKLVKDALEKKK